LRNVSGPGHLKALHLGIADFDSALQAEVQAECRHMPKFAHSLGAAAVHRMRLGKAASALPLLGLHILAAAR